MARDGKYDQKLEAKEAKVRAEAESYLEKVKLDQNALRTALEGDVEPPLHPAAACPRAAQAVNAGQTHVGGQRPRTSSTVG